MLCLLQIFALLFLGALFAFRKYVRSRNFAKSRNESSCEKPYILRRQDYETYQKIKYGSGGAPAALSGSGGPLVLVDLDLIRRVNQRDFAQFPDRHPSGYHSDPTMNKMLSFATGAEWKRLKSVLTQAFSPSRVRGIYGTLDETGVKLVNFLRNQMTDGGALELEIVGPVNKYLLELIACSVFGLHETGIFGPGAQDCSPFEVHTKEIQKAMVRHRRARVLPPGGLQIANLIGWTSPDKRAVQFFRSAIENSVNHRRGRGEKTDDLLQLLLEANGKGDGAGVEEEILSQALMFFFAGTEGPATLLIYGLYELAMNLDVHEKLWDEIRGLEVLPDYDALNSLPNLDNFVSEVLRCYSSGVTARRCTTKYAVPGTNLVLEPGARVHTPIYGIHHDPEFYPNPFKFNPDNFSPEAKQMRQAGAYIPFGIGPRSCISQKFALVQGKSAIYHLVRNFKLEPCSRTETPPNGSMESMYLPEKGLWLNIVDRIAK